MSASTTGRLIITSNRLPVTIRVEKGVPRLTPSSGGLATAMKGPHQRTGGLWVGWPGDLSRLSAADRETVARELAALRTVPVQLTASEVAHHYDGFANGVLWPLFHYLLDKVNLDAGRDWRVFHEVNQKFAHQLASQLQEGDQVWVHDYHLALVPGMLRRLRPEARIGFFLHVPFPASDVFRILPWREEILRGILGADLVGFHTAIYRHNFNHAAAQVLGLDLDEDALAFEGRTVRTGAYPISIDVESFERAADSPEVATRVQALRAAAAGKKILLGIDRLDYTKGIPRRLLAVDRLLEQSPELRQQVHFIQLAVPTRERVEAYADLRRTVNELVGRLNSQHGSPTGVPLHFLYRSASFTELVALYRAADVMLVTPLRDGMNLVAKEYVASRTDQRGVLVLSEFAGAAAELPESLQVNPYDIGAVARAVKTAIEMPAEQQRLRMNFLRTAVRSHDVHRWAETFLGDLTAADPVSATAPAEPSPSVSGEMKRARDASGRLIVLDYDGTLVSLAPLPELAAPDEPLRHLLARLTALPSTQVHIVSGRPRQSLQDWLGDLPVGLHAEHGFWSRQAGGDWVANRPPPGDWKKPVLAPMQQQARRTPGCFVEEKTSSVAFHYRAAEPNLAADRLRELRQRLAPVLETHGLEFLDGSRVLEVRLRGVHKGGVIPGLLARAPAGAVVLAAGDDVTDEDMFRALPPGAISIKVGAGRSVARWCVATPAALREELWSLCRPADAGN